MTSTSTAASVKFASVTPNLIVRDVAKSTAFYRDILGFEIKETVPANEPFVFVMLMRDGVPVFLERHMHRSWQPPARQQPHEEEAKLHERQNDAGPVDSRRRDQIAAECCDARQQNDK